MNQYRSTTLKPILSINKKIRYNNKNSTHGPNNSTKKFTNENKLHKQKIIQTIQKSTPLPCAIVA
jgi:hypothetical protein